MLLKHQRVRIFREFELSKATKNFDATHFLGEGGFGRVYKGILPDNTVVAIKKPKGSIDKAQTINQEFEHEITIVSQVNHIHVVKVVGLCLETKLPLLVYEFIPNGTLFDHVHRKRSDLMSTWKNRTLGYLDPEYLVTGNLTPMSDVYSFGVVMVELLTGRKPYSGSSTRTEEKVNLVQYFLSSVGDMNLGRIVNFVVAREGEMEEIEAFAEVARRCLSSSGIKRPVMKEVAEELGRLLRRLDKNSWESDRKGDNGGEEMECLLRKNGGESCSMSFGGGSEFWSVRTEEPPATETHSIVAMEMGSYEIFR
ncbi:unnamed protein product [Linum tenue]|uniref:Protein kinase domain-containing protein n=1 Tax=Linum tenue TaxID=586396 RepID=A0AAV0IIW5_9ROSI|nr:unnamed protein product [Linum tenue]